MYGLAEIKNVVINPNNKFISKLTENELLTAIDNALESAYKDVGHLPTKVDKDYIAGNLYSLIKAKYSFMRPQEITIAFRNGVARKYGEYFGYNFATFQNFLQAYVKSDERLEASKIALSMAEQNLLPEKPFDPVEYEKWVYDMWKEKGVIFDMTGAAYYYLEQQGKINFTKEQKWEFYQQAEQIQIEKKGKDKHTLEGLRELQTYLDKIKHKDHLTIEAIKDKARKIALEQYYKTLDGK